MAVATAASLRSAGTDAALLAVAFLSMSLAVIPALPTLKNLNAGPAGLLAMAFAMWLLIAVLASEVPAISAQAALTLALFFLGWLVIGAQAGDADRIAVIAAAGFAILACAALGWIQVADRQLPHGTFVNRNSFASLLVFGTFLWCGMLHQLAAHPHRRLWPLAVGVGITGCLFMLVGFTGSRGAVLGAAAGFLVLLALTGGRRQLPVIVAVAALASLAIAELSGAAGDHSAVSRLGDTLADPAGAGKNRLRMWASALPLLGARPLLGTGPGTFWLHWAPHRHPADSTAGWHAHNDYLQFAVETGFPGVVLLLTMLVVLLLTAWRYRRGSVLSAWLMAGIVAITVHSLVTFNLQLAPMLLAAGVASGWVSSRAEPVSGPRLDAIPRVARPVFACVLLGLVLYAGTSMVGYHHFRKAMAADEMGAYFPAYAAATAAIRWWPSAEPPRRLRARILRRGIVDTDSPTIGDIRSVALAEALGDLTVAQRLNPYLADPLAEQAFLLQAAMRRGLRKDVTTDVVALYRQALALQPRHLGARLELATVLEDAGNVGLALEVLNEGVLHWYPALPIRTEFHQQIRDLAERLGADEVLERLPEP